MILGCSLEIAEAICKICAIRSSRIGLVGVLSKHRGCRTGRYLILVGRTAPFSSKGVEIPKGTVLRCHSSGSFLADVLIVQASEECSKNGVKHS